MSDEVLKDVESASEFDTVVSRWNEELRSYDKKAEIWIKDAQRIYDRYELEGERDQGSKARFNVLWSSVQTVIPSLYSQTPVPVVERKYRDQDAVGRVAAQVLQRAIIADMERDNFDDVMDAIVLDSVITGRGVPWVRYDPTFSTTEVPLTISEDMKYKSEGGQEFSEEDYILKGDQAYGEVEEVVDERAPVDYIYWKDFFHKPVKNWAELMMTGWVAKRVYMTKEQGMKRFGEIFDKVPLDNGPDWLGEKDEIPALFASAEVYEIWDAPTKKVYWICRNYKDAVLGEQDDPLGLEQFFPCIKPILGTITNKSMIPIPDYLQYEHLATELNTITIRIDILTDALRVRGIYDSSLQNLESLLSSDVESPMFPVDNLSSFLNKSTGSVISNVVQFMPIDMIAQVLVVLYDSREKVKQTLYEVSGISDIVRGQVDPREKLGQSRIKAQFASSRLDIKRKKIEYSAKMVIALKGEIIAEHFETDMIRSMSGFDMIQEVVSMQDETQREELFKAIIKLLRDNKMRGFRVDIETDSTIMVDEQQAKETRIEFLESAGAFLQQTLPLAQSLPQLAPLLGEMMLFAIRGFKAGRLLEFSFEQAVEQMREAAKKQQEAPPEPSPEEQRMQMEMKQKEQQMQMEMKQKEQQMQFDQQKAQLDLQTKAESAKIDASKSQMDLSVKEQEIQLKRQELDIKREELNLKREELKIKEKEVKKNDS